VQAGAGGQTGRAQVASRWLSLGRSLLCLHDLQLQYCRNTRTAIMVHLRLNERETNPNPHINFITPLPTADQEAQEDARQLLRALAAQVRPVMKAHGFSVNSFEEVR